MARQFTRSEFYELVWSKPMTHLAKEFGLSDVALHKICRKHDVPNPPLGWWAKHAAGQSVKRTPLPKLKSGISDTINIAGGELRNEPDSVAQIREEARVRASAFNPKTVDQEHSIVTRSMAKLRKAKPDERGLVRIAQSGLIDAEIAPDSIDRIELSLNRIVTAAQVQGFELSGKGERAAFTDGSVIVPFSLKEAVKRSQHEPTPEELAKEAKERKRRERRWARNDWDYAPSFSSFSHWPEWDYAPTGKVSFEFDLYLRYSSALRRSFKDAKIQRLENIANDIAVGLAVLATAKREDDRRAEEDRIRAEEEVRRRNEARRLAYIEDRRLKVLDLVFERVVKRDRLRRLASQLTEELEATPSPRSAEFLDWLNAIVERAERASSVEGFEVLFEAEHVFGPDDDKGFYPSRYGW
ncbi:MAG: hypothetical protein ABJP48_10555 [Erythrobacter sp.]